MGLFDLFKHKPTAVEIQKDANRQLAAADLSKFQKIHTKLVGVTFKNPDGSDRQQIISRLQPGDAMQIRPYMFKGKEAIAVMTASGQIAGHLSAEMTEILFTDHKGARMVVSVNKITGGGSGQSFGCNIDLYIEQ